MTRDSWWIDLLENELPLELRQDVAKIFARSPHDMRALTELSRLRESLRQADPSVALWDEEKASDLTQKILFGLQIHIKSVPTRRLVAVRDQDEQLKAGST